ncbi:MAG: SHOCT domain-containing protein [Coriobacteriia bacterium]
MMFGWFFIPILLGLGFWWLVQQQQYGGGRTPFPPRRDDPVEIARMRYAHGEISKEQYEEIRRTLG